MQGIQLCYVFSFFFFFFYFFASLACLIFCFYKFTSKLLSGRSEFVFSVVRDFSLDESSASQRNKRSQMFLRIAVLKKFTILLRKHLCWSLKHKKTLQHRCFSVILQNFKNSFFTEHPRWLLLSLVFQQHNQEFLMFGYCFYFLTNKKLVGTQLNIS